MRSLALGGPAMRYGIVAIAALACGQLAAAAESAKSADDAFKESLKSGKPILAVLGSETWGPCVALRKKIETDPNWQSVVARYVYLHIDMNKEQDNRRAWETKYPSKGTGIPQVTIVSSDGRELHNKSGGVGLNDLTEYLSKSGTLLSERALAQIREAVEAAQKALDAGDVPTAVSTITPVLGSGGAGEDVQKAEAFGNKLIEDAKAKFKEAEEKLASADTALEAAVEILQMSRDYAKLRALADDLKKLRIVQNHKDHRDNFEQARLLDQAALRATAKNKKDAVAKYEFVIRKWPDTPAAKYASTKLAELGKENVIVVDIGGSKNAGDDKAKDGTAKDGTTKTAGSSTAKNGPKVSKAVAERTAKSLLSTAETLAAINQKDEARKKAEEVIGLVPGTDLAKRAEALIKKL